MRGPLNNTLQLLEILEDRLPNDEAFVNKVLDKIRLSIDRGNQLIKNLLDVNRIHSGEPLPLNRQKSDLIPVIRELLNNYKAETRERIDFKSSSDQVIDNWDTDALRRAIDNLVSNALKYGSEEGEIRLDVEQDGIDTKIMVHNNGNTIPPEKLDKLFDLYYRTRDVKGQQGWGLGLTLVQGVAEAHKGRVEVRSHPDEGTTFSVVIPK